MPAEQFRCPHTPLSGGQVQRQARGERNGERVQFVYGFHNHILSRLTSEEYIASQAPVQFLSPLLLTLIFSFLYLSFLSPPSNRRLPVPGLYFF